MEIYMDGLTKNYGKIRALNSINLKIEGHGCTGLLGPNGAGKTTMLKLVTNIIKPSKGKVELNSVDVSVYPEKALENVGALIEQPEFYSYLTGYEILEFTAKIKGLNKEEFASEVKRLEDLTEINSFLYRKTGSYSRGMKQRLALSVAMLGNPEIIILDEPTFGLDPKGMVDIRNIIKSLAKDHLVLLSTHLIYEARELCDRTIIINRGKIEYDSAMAPERDLIKITAENNINILGDKIRDYTRNGNVFIIEKNGKVNNADIIAELMEQGLIIDYVEKYDNLEDIYVSVINGKITDNNLS
ncbi:MAG: ABC transporter ATP-binding protein [Ferroplasma sp.]|uniref:ABC transporter ATP-binding protein n=1 Tax=Ferroplasma sp. TaxID=2591003 RepID=UPI002814E6B6|nr:ABC transporter ATP-binding protein [Ferroplasma sp.]WMT52277.1 MAG: ABC transporter ATP-binding protein [Ferroplasma sp.]